MAAKHITIPEERTKATFTTSHSKFCYFITYIICIDPCGWSTCVTACSGPTPVRLAEREDVSAICVCEQELCSIKYGGKNLSGDVIKHCHSILFCLCDFVLFLVILSRFFGHHHQIDARISRTPKRVSSTGQTRKTSSTWWNFDSFFIPSWDSNKFDFFYFLQRFNLIRYLETCICFPILLATVQTSALEPLT